MFHNFSFKTKILTLVIVPLVLVSTAITIASTLLIQNYGESNILSVSHYLREARIKELDNYTTLALSSIRHLEKSRVIDRNKQKKSAKQILKNLEFGGDGYFFVYDYKGKNIAHPKKPHLEGRHLLDLKDVNGVKIIEELIHAAKKDGGVVSYRWDKPSVGEKVEKLGYAKGINEWQWMVGTGIYADDIVKAESDLRDNLSTNLKNSLILLPAVAVIVLLGTLIVAGRYTFIEGKIADENIKTASSRYKNIQEDVKNEFFDQLHASIIQPIENTIDKIGTGNLTDIERELITIFKNASNLSQTLRPEIIDEDGLFPAIKQIIAQCQDSSSLHISYEMPETTSVIPDNIEIKVYRVIQELLAYARDYSGSKSISLKIRLSDKSLSLIYQDDGEGVEPEANKFAGVYDQVESANGQISKYSTPNIGTMIRVAIPI